MSPRSCWHLTNLLHVIVGGGNTAENGRLAAILQKARAMNFPRDKIEIAIQTVRTCYLPESFALLIM
jgi:siroheme synthase (precorrin-2 oxidase/ferrochelatase)